MDTTIRLGIALLASTALAPAAFAQDVGETDQRSDDHKHGSEPVEIVITGALPDSTLLENVRTLDENAIVTELDTQIGEKLREYSRVRVGSGLRDRRFIRPAVTSLIPTFGVRVLVRRDTSGECPEPGQRIRERLASLRTAQ